MNLHVVDIKNLILEYDKPFTLLDLYSYFAAIKVNDKGLILQALNELYDNGLLYHEEITLDSGDSIYAFFTDSYKQNKRSR